MMLEILKKSGVELPPEETDASILYGKEIHSKIRDWQERFEGSKQLFQDSGIVEEFMELIAKYPVSMCRKTMTETLKLLIALYYFWHPTGYQWFRREDLEIGAMFSDSQLEEANRNFEKRFQEECMPSYEHLSLIFDKSKATVFDAIKASGNEANRLLEDCSKRRNVRKLAMADLVEEEKKRLLSLQKQATTMPNDQTNASTTRSEAIGSTKPDEAFDT